MSYVIIGLICMYVGWYLSKREYEIKQKRRKFAPCEPPRRETRDFMYVETWNGDKHKISMKELKDNA